jgi:oligoribonuclease NrnB/cAMP/cGMP phosphodiesterase (DHH superfamily)
VADIEVYDHHLSFQRIWEGRWTDKLHYDVTHSGAYLAWRYYFGDEPPPLLILYVEDRDIWSWSQPNSKEINEALFADSPMYSEPDTWIERYFSFDTREAEQSYFDGLQRNGELLMRVKEMRCKTLFRTGKVIELNGIRVFSVNASHMDASDLGNYAVSQLTDDDKYLCDAALVWRINTETGRVDISARTLNTRDPNIDVSAICAKYGGGGHRNAGGFELGLEHLNMLL